MAVGSRASGIVQLGYASLTRHVSRRALLGVGGIVFGAGFAAQAVAPSFSAFAAANVASKIGGSPQHPLGNGLLAEQFRPSDTALRSPPTSPAGTWGPSSLPWPGRG